MARGYGLTKPVQLIWGPSLSHSCELSRKNVELGCQADKAPGLRWKYPLGQQAGLIPVGTFASTRGREAVWEGRAYRFAVSLTLTLSSTAY